MKKIILSYLLCLASTQAKIDYTLGIHLGADKETGKITDTVTQPQDFYRYGQKNKSSGLLGGVNFGLQTQLSQLIIGANIEISVATAKQIQTQHPHDSGMGGHKLYRRELRHLGGQNIGLKIGYAVMPGFNVFVRPMIGVDRFQTKIMYMDDLSHPVNNRRKNNHLFAKGIGLGLEKKTGNMIVGLEGRYVKNSTLKQSHTFFSGFQDVTTLKSKPSRYVAMIKMSYVF